MVKGGRGGRGREREKEEGRVGEINKGEKTTTKKKESPKKDLNLQPVVIHGLLDSH